MFSDRKAFNFFKSYWEIGKELDDVNRVMFYDALLKLQFTGEQTELSGMAKFAWISQKHSIDSQLKGLESRYKAPVTTNPNGGGNGGGRSGGDGGAAPQVQVQEKEEEQVQVKVQVVKESINERKLKFAHSLTPFLEFYTKEMIRAFCDYWTEHGEKDKKFRAEKEKSFAIDRRLKTWKDNESKFNKNGSSTNQGYKPASVDREKLIRELTEDAENGNIPGVYSTL